MRRHFAASMLVAAASAFSASAQPVTPAFVYQGEIRASGQPSDGPVDLRFRLYDAAVGGSQIGGALQTSGTVLSAGRFSVSLDFGAVYGSQSRWLEIDVRPAGAGNFVTLAPRQVLAAAPVASYAMNIPAQYNTFNASGGNAILSSGNVGIGTSTPAAGLHVTSTQGGLSLDASENLFVNDTQDFVGVNRSTRATSAEVFGLQNTPAQTGFVGMYISSTSASGLPFYGYRTPSLFGWTQMDDSGAWKVHMNGADRLVLSPTGNLGVGAASPLYPLHVQSSVQTLGQLESSNTGGTWFNLNNTASGRTWNLISTGSANGEGPGKLLVRDATVNGVRMTFDTAGNVGVGTTSPAYKLDVNGAVRASGGVVFPDGSTQVRAGSAAPLVASGLPAGSTFTVTIGGLPATFSGRYALRHPVSADASGYWAYNAMNVDDVITVRRPRTADQTWVNWILSVQSRALVMTLAVPGGASIVWSGNVYPVTVRVETVGGVLHETLDLGVGLSPGLVRTVNGAPAVTAPTGDLPGVSLLLNGAAIQNVAYLSPAPVVSFDGHDQASGFPTGQIHGPTVNFRVNPFSQPALFTRMVPNDGSAIPARFNLGAVSMVASSSSFFTKYSLRLADDGLPIEEYEVRLDRN